MSQAELGAAKRLWTWLRRCGKRLRDGAEEGLTLIEMLAVVVIIAIVAAIAIPAVSSAIRTSKMDATEATLGTLQTALARYNLDMGQYPSSLSLLVSGTLSTGPSGWEGPYLNDAVPLDDSWNNPIYYDPIETSGTVTGYILVSGDGASLMRASGGLGLTSGSALSSSSTTPLIIAAGGVDLSGSSVVPLGMHPEQDNLKALSSSTIAAAQLIVQQITGTATPTPQWTDQ